MHKLITQEKKLKEDKEKAGEDLLKLHEELAKLQAKMALAAGRLSHLRKTKNKMKEHRVAQFKQGIQGLKGEDHLAEELSHHEATVAEELQSLNPSGVDWDSLGLGGFGFDPLPGSDVVGESSSAVVEPR